MNRREAFPILLCAALGVVTPGHPGRAVAPDWAEADFFRLRGSIAEILADMAERPELFPPRPLEAPRVLALEPRVEARRVWASFYDRLLALDAIAIAGGRAGSPGANLPLHHAASVAHYRYALDFIERVEHDPALDRVLNEADLALGLPVLAYRELKDRILSVERAGCFATRRLSDHVAYAGSSAGIEQAIRSDAARIWEMGRGPGPRLTARHLANRVEEVASDAALPLQERLARGMAEIRVRRVGSALISPSQIAALHMRLEPGDIFLTRREWYMSNVGIPGFWSHAALYVGTPEERKSHFATPEVAARVRARAGRDAALEDLITLPSPSPSARGGVPRVLEAIAEGVAFTTLERAAHADSIAVLRPLVGDTEKARAIWRAFQYAGRPYDYNFDFRSDDTLVCSELIYKAYRELPGEQGIALPLARTLGRPMISPNELARLFAVGERPRFELVAFLDGDERAGRARERGEAAFRESWSRPKWHILLPGDAGEEAHPQTPGEGPARPAGEKGPADSDTAGIRSPRKVATGR